MERDLQEIKEEVRARTDIVEIIGGFTRLTKAGKNWKGRCPFHDDKNPSFSVTPQFQSYRCWSCGEKGDVFTFLQKKMNMEFMDALEFLAKQAGIPFERRGSGSPEQLSERERMLALNQIAVQYYRDCLSRASIAQSYLAQRGILRPTQDQFDLGYAPDDWDALVGHLQKQRADLALAVKIGLIKERKQEGSGYYDSFRNRLMFPIHDVSGRVVAFGGRAMGDDPAKYLNSEQSPIFNKSRTLYGLFFARKKLSGDVSPVFVEGYMDVVTTHQAGFAQCVATLGTSMTEEHAQMLAKYNPRVIICYDADAAGIKATLRSAAVWETVGVEGAEMRVARLPAGDDPDSLLKRGETAAFQTALDNAVPRVDFEIELILKRHDPNTEDGKYAALAEIIPILASLSKQSERQRYAMKLAHLSPGHDRLGVGRAIESILADVETYARESRNAQSPRDRGYPLTREANHTPLQQEPPPNAYRPPQPDRWGAWDPNTRNMVRKGDGRSPNGYGRSGGGTGGNGQQGYGNRRAPIGDSTPPSLTAPLLTGPERAERALLRALFTPEWRAFVLNNLSPTYLVTEPGRRLFAQVARTPPDAEGGVDPLLLLRQAEAEEESKEAFAAGEALPSGEVLPSQPQSADEARKIFAKMSDFIREVLEESASAVSNEPINEAAVHDCIRKLRKNREDLATRELVENLRREDLTPEQRHALQQQYHERMRALRGSSSGESV